MFNVPYYFTECRVVSDFSTVSVPDRPTPPPPTTPSETPCLRALKTAQAAGIPLLSRPGLWNLT